MRVVTTPPNPHMAVPPVLLMHPAADAVVRPSFTVSGTTSSHTVTIELLRGGVLAQQEVRPTGRGTFVLRLHATPGPLTIEATAAGASIDVPVTVSP